MKPPTGVLPEYIFEQKVTDLINVAGGVHMDSIIRMRMEDLSDAIHRYYQAGYRPRIEWLIEYSNKATQLLGKVNP